MVEVNNLHRFSSIPGFDGRDLVAQSGLTGRTKWARQIVEKITAAVVPEIMEVAQVPLSLKPLPPASPFGCEA